jgi:hypothetical protein
LFYLREILAVPRASVSVKVPRTPAGSGAFTEREKRIMIQGIFVAVGRTRHASMTWPDDIEARRRSTRAAEWNCRIGIAKKLMARRHHTGIARGIDP